MCMTCKGCGLEYETLMDDFVCWRCETAAQVRLDELNDEPCRMCSGTGEFWPDRCCPVCLGKG